MKFKSLPNGIWYYEESSLLCYITDEETGITINLDTNESWTWESFGDDPPHKTKGWVYLGTLTDLSCLLVDKLK